MLNTDNNLVQLNICQKNSSHLKTLFWNLEHLHFNYIIKGENERRIGLAISQLQL